MLFKQTLVLFKKELTLEWRQRYALNGLLLYIVSTVMITYLSFNLKFQKISPITWNALFWIIVLFTAINAIAKSFMQESYGRFLYYYTIASPQAIILSKMLYNAILMLVISTLGLSVYMVVLGNPIEDLLLFSINLFLGSIGFSSTLTMVSSIAAKARNNATLMAILSFPVILPMLLMLIRVSKNAIDGLDRSLSYDEILTLTAINTIVFVVSLLLFPYIWRS